MTPADNTSSSQPSTYRELLLFRLGAEEYGIDILRVREIRSYETPTRIAGAPAHVLGIVNLRGDIVPVVDLRMHFGYESQPYTSTTVVIILKVGALLVGLVVDSVTDVVSLASNTLQAPPTVNAAERASIVGLGTLGEGDAQRMVIVLQAEKLTKGLGIRPAGASAEFATPAAAVAA